MLFQALVLCHFEHSALFLMQTTSTRLLALEKKMNWSSKSVHFRSSIQLSCGLRIYKSTLSVRQLTELKSLTFFLQLTNKENLHRQNKVTHRMFSIEQPFKSNISFGEGTIGFIFLEVFFHHISLKWNSLPLSMCDTSGGLQIIKSRLKSFFLSETNAVS